MKRKIQSHRILFLLSSVRSVRRSSALAHRSLTFRAHAMLFILDGEGTIFIQGTAYRALPLQLYALLPGTRLDIHQHSEEARYYLVTYRAVELQRSRGSWEANAAPNELGPFPLGPMSLVDPEEVRMKLDSLYASFRERKDQDLQDLQFQELWRYLVSERANQEESTRESNGIEDSVAYIHEHYDEKLTREELARIAKLTPTSYGRSFKKTKGIPPMDYLNLLRVEHAKQLLLSGSPIKETASLIGFSSEYYFSRVFKKFTGLPPTMFLKRNGLRVAVASRFDYHHILGSLGTQPICVVDCYKHPGLDEDDYQRRLASQLKELRKSAPDLIIGDFSHAALHDSFKLIATTVIFDYDVDWKVNFRGIAKLLGYERESEQVMDSLGKRCVRAREQLLKAVGGERITVLQIMHDHVILQGAVHHPLNELLYDELGLKPGGAVPLHKMRRELYPQDVPPLATDWLWIRLYSDHDEVRTTLTRLQEQPWWHDLEAVRLNQVRYLPNWLITSWNPLGRFQIIDEVIQLLDHD